MKSITEKPIIFNSEMVKAILAGRKSMTRRVVMPQPSKERKFVGYSTDLGYPESTNYFWAGFGIGDKSPAYFKCPYKVGMKLWVRETFCKNPSNRIIYKADVIKYESIYKWKPSIFMPRWASRINLEITDIRIEQIHDISEDDAWDEGIDEAKVEKLPYINKYGVNCAIAVFSDLWESINEKKGYGWAENPWCFCYKFKRIK
jgi:hypothetical protein